MSRNSGISGISLVFTLVVLIFLFGCYQEQEGCLDVKATNFDVSADLACLDCCEFPELSITFQHRAILGEDTINFSYDSLYFVTVADTNQYFEFDQIRYYISDVSLQTQTGNLQVIDSITLFEYNNNADIDGTPYIDDFILVDRDFPSSYDIGTILGTGTVESVNFRLGLSDQIELVDPEQVEGGHPLELLTAGALWDGSTGYTSNYITYFPDTLATDSLIIPITESVEIELVPDEPFVIEEGADLTLVIFIDYMAWFDGVNIVVDPINQVRTKIVSNVSNSFGFVEVK